MRLIPEVTLSDKIKISKEYITDKELSSEFVYHLDDGFVTTLQEDEENWYLGIGCLPRLNVENVIDNRISKKLDQKVEFKATLKPAQERTLQQFVKEENYDSGILKAKCGWGKSFWGVKLVTEAGDHTMILMHTKLLQDQWRELFLKFTDYDPGMIGDGVFNPKPITLGLYISVNNRLDEIKNNYGRVIVDEVHRCGAELFSDTLTRFPARYKNGMSATPSRRDGKHVLFNDYFSDRFVEAEEYRDLIKPDVDIRQVPFKFEVRNPTTDWARALTKIYSNTDYLDMIVGHANSLIADGRTVLIIGGRVEALEYLQERILFSAVLIGKTKNRDEIVSGIGTKYKCVLSTTIFDEGLSAHLLDTLFLTGPIGKNFQLLEQRIGRIQREHPDKQPALIVAYWLQNHILAKQQSIEHRWYLSKNYKILT